MKIIINPLVAHSIEGASAVFIAESKEEIIKHINKIHEKTCNNCYLFDFGYVDDEKKRTSIGNGYSIWRTKFDDDGEEIDQEIEQGEDEEYFKIDNAYLNDTIEMTQCGDEFMFYIQMFDSETGEPQLDNIHLVYHLIREIAVENSYDNKEESNKGKK